MKAEFKLQIKHFCRQKNQLKNEETYHELVAKIELLHEIIILCA